MLARLNKTFGFFLRKNPSKLNRLVRVKNKDRRNNNLTKKLV